LGGDAGSEGESEAEQKETGCCHSSIKKDEKSKELPLRPEASALDRPPKAPAMLSLPNDEHELGHIEEKSEITLADKDSSVETVEQTVFQSVTLPTARAALLSHRLKQVPEKYSLALLTGTAFAQIRLHRIIYHPSLFPVYFRANAIDF
uniref:BTB domain-containing protein n=1 Tax=Gongylonema pulchrum TaxID=637853 RepID=A0A183DDI6_9BILA